MKKTPFVLPALLLVLQPVSMHAQSSRLVGTGISYYHLGVFEPQDTIFYKYTGTRGYDSLNRMWKYDNATSQNNYNPALNSYTTTNYDAQGFDLLNNDTAFSDQYIVSGTLTNNVKKIYHYTIAGYIDTLTEQNWNSGAGTWINSSKTATIYNSKNDIIQTIELVWNTLTGTWANNSVSYYSYDLAGDNTVVNTLNWNTTSNAYDSFSRLINVFDGSHDRLTQNGQMWNPPTNSWNNYDMYIDSGFVATQPIVQRLLWWQTSTSTYDTEEAYRFTYNSYNQVLTKIPDMNSGTAWQYQYGYHYYYETYASGINNIAAAGGDANIYPVPADNTLNIDLKWDEPQPFSIAIVDMQGRITNQWNVEATTNYHKTISLSSFPAGNYFIKINGTKGEIVKRLVITSEK